MDDLTDIDSLFTYEKIAERAEKYAKDKALTCFREAYKCCSDSDEFSKVMNHNRLYRNDSDNPYYWIGRYSAYKDMEAFLRVYIKQIKKGEQK